MDPSHLQVLCTVVWFHERKYLVECALKVTVARILWLRLFILADGILTLVQST
jgi:hypothetical protein